MVCNTTELADRLLAEFEFLKKAALENAEINGGKLLPDSDGDNLDTGEDIKTGGKNV